MKNPLAILTLGSFLISSITGPLPQASADDFRLPAPGVMVHLSPEFNPPILKGIKVHPNNPFRFDFILDQGDDSKKNSSVKMPYGGDIVKSSSGVITRREATKQSQQEQLKQEAIKLIKYFLASLTIPEKDIWVNLSPYEKDRIVPESFGQTEMGRDLLAEDYMLKQITASLIYPEDEIGKKFWKRIYEEAAKKFGTTNIPVNTFNKVWIIPGKAVVYENTKAGTAYVVESKLKVMLEQDYLSLKKQNNVNALGSQIVRAIVIPELTKEVNENKNFSKLRQLYNSLILATWYKKKIKDSILFQIYADKNKIAGVSIDDPQEKEKIYQQYLKAFKKGVYNYIKEEIDPVTQKTMPRKYFSGGFNFSRATISFIKTLSDSAMHVKDLVEVDSNFDRASISRVDIPYEGIIAELTQYLKLKNMNWEHFSKQENLEQPLWHEIFDLYLKLYNDKKYVDDRQQDIGDNGDQNGFKDFVKKYDEVFIVRDDHKRIARFLLGKRTSFGIKINLIGSDDHIINKKQLLDALAHINGIRGVYLEISGIVEKSILSFLMDALNDRINGRDLKQNFTIVNPRLAGVLKNDDIDLDIDGVHYSKLMRSAQKTLKVKRVLIGQPIIAHRFLESLGISSAYIPVRDGLLLNFFYQRTLERYSKSPQELYSIFFKILESGKKNIFNVRGLGTQLKNPAVIEGINSDMQQFEDFLDAWRVQMFRASFIEQILLLQEKSHSLESVSEVIHMLEVFTDSHTSLSKSRTEDKVFVKLFEESKRLLIELRGKAGIGKGSEYHLNLVEENKGGIDLTPANMNIKVKTGSPTDTFGDDKGNLSDGNGGIKFHFDPAMLDQLQNASGFVPVIINIQPMKNLKIFLDIN